MTLTLEDEGPVEFHVDNFEEAAERLETAGFPIERRDRHGGKVRDPSGNLIGLHDHRE